MKKSLHAHAIPLSVLFFMTIACTLTAQEITYTLTENNLGITSTIGQFGAGWADYDGDGDLDLLISGQGGKPVLYRNDNGSFTDVSAEMKLNNASVTSYGNQPAWFDYDRDGRLDLLFAKGLNLLVQTDTGFVDFSTAAGLSTIPDKDAYWSVAVGDYDKDGDLDIAASGGTQGASSLLGPLVLLNNDGGIYSDVTWNTFLLETWGMAWVDYDNDRDLDLWAPTIRSPFEMNHLFVNTAGEFDDSPLETFQADSMNDAIVSGWADYDNDGDMDLFCMPFNSTAGVSYNKSQFWRNNGDGTLTDIAPELGLTAAFSSRGFSWGDYDNDGDQDLLIGGRLTAQSLYRNDDGQFVNVATEVGIAGFVEGYGSVHFVDYNNDGFLDIFLAKGDSPDQKLLQSSGNSNHWIVIKPKGVTDNTAGVGARVRVVAGGLSMIRDIEGSGPGLSSGKLWAHCGLGTASTADSVIIQWPTGAVDVAANVAADKYYTFEQGVGLQTGVAEKPDHLPTGYALSQNFPNPFNPVTTIQFQLPVESSVRLVLINTLGTVVQELANGEFAAGNHEVTVDAKNLAAGIYFYKIETGEFNDVRKCLLVK